MTSHLAESRHSVLMMTSFSIRSLEIKPLVIMLDSYSLVNGIQNSNSDP